MSLRWCPSQTGHSSWVFCSARGQVGSTHLYQQQLPTVGMARCRVRRLQECDAHLVALGDTGWVRAGPLFKLPLHVPTLPRLPAMPPAAPRLAGFLWG